MWQSWMGWKMPPCKWHTFWMAPSKLSGKFERFNAIDGNIEMLKNG